jgi:WD40 repeat protein
MKRISRTIGLALGTVLIATLTVSYLSAAPKFSAWSTPVNLASVNSAFDDGGPAISKNDLSLYFHSTRPGGPGNTDIWVTQRENVADSWGVPQPLGLNVNSTFAENSPNLSRDGHLLFFSSDRPGGSGDLDIWVSWREHTHDDFGWQPAVNLGKTINTAAIDAGQAYFDNDGFGHAVPRGNCRLGVQNRS